MSLPKNADDWEVVESFEDFVELLRLLALDWELDEAKRLQREAAGLWAGEGETWTQGTPGAWMEATHAWLTDSDRGQEIEASWRTFAWILSAGRYYE